MSYFVYSTLGQDMEYNAYVKQPEGPVKCSGVLIRGGAGVIVVKTKDTPIGIRTEISDEQCKALVGEKENEGNQVFKKHIKNGFIQVVKGKEKVSTMVKDMEPKDNSAQKTVKELKDLADKEAAKNRKPE